MNINGRIRLQLEKIKELEIITHSIDFENATFDKKKEILETKKSELNKLGFLYNLQKTFMNDKINRKII